MGTGSLWFMSAAVLAALAWNGRLVLDRPILWWQWADAALLVLLAVYVMSGLMMADQGNPRATINAVWQWIGFGMVYLVARQMLRRAVDRRAVCVVLLALATALATVSFYEYFFSMPRLRARYAADPEEVLREVGIPATAGSPERKLFEDRLQSTPPIVTFALTNSLAGFLAPWFIVAVGIGWEARRAVNDWRAFWRDRRVVAVTLCGLFISFCLLLTTSRSAFLAVACGLIAIMGYRRLGRWWDGRLLLAGGVLAVVLLGGALAAGAFDWLTLSEAPKSLLYRFEYWQATWSLITDHPWFGCGPGNFQQYYAFYKLPQASETIADPHNFFFEVWANAGTPAMLALVAFLVLVVRRVSNSLAVGRANEGRDRGDRAEIAEASSAVWVWGGALVGVLLAFPVGTVVGFPPPPALLWLGLPVGGLIVVLLHRWVAATSTSATGVTDSSDGARLPAWLLLIAILVLLTNLLAAGGISYAGVSISLWLLAALALNQTGADRQLRLSAWMGGVLGVGLVVMVLLCQRTMYGPLLSAQSRLNAGWAAAAAGRGERADRLFRSAAEADPFSPQPWMQLALLHHQRLLGTSSPDRAAEGLAQFDQAVEQALRRNRRGFAPRRQIGDWRLALYRHWNDGRQLDRAIDSYEEVVRLYPHGIAGRVQLAWVYHLAGREAEAREQAGEALRLDAATPHQERKLANLVPFDPTLAARGEVNAEQLMLRLRNGSHL